MRPKTPLSSPTLRPCPTHFALVQDAVHRAHLAGGARAKDLPEAMLRQRPHYLLHGDPALHHLELALQGRELSPSRPQRSDTPGGDRRLEGGGQSHGGVPQPLPHSPCHTGPLLSSAPPHPEPPQLTQV